MPIGILIMQWDERGGVTIIGQYPENLQFSEKTLMQVYSTHEYSGALGMISLTVGNTNIASYYFSKEKSCYLLLILNEGEDADPFEDGMTEVSGTILAHLGKEDFLSLLPSFYKLISSYPTMKSEQRLARVCQDETRRKVLQRLREEGALVKSELDIWLRDLNRGRIVDIDDILKPLIKEGLVKSVTVKALVTEVVFITNDTAIYRRPPVSLVNESSSRGLPAALKKVYENTVKKYFTEDRPSEEDNVAILNLVADPETYEVISLMREAIVTRNDLIKLKNNNEDELDEVLKKLWDCGIICVLRDIIGTEYYALQSDIVVQKFFPEYMLNIVQQSAAEHTKADFVLLEHLNILEEVYKGPKEHPRRSTAEVEALTEHIPSARIAVKTKAKTKTPAKSKVEGKRTIAAGTETQVKSKSEGKSSVAASIEIPTKSDVELDILTTPLEMLHPDSPSSTGRENDITEGEETMKPRHTISQNLKKNEPSIPKPALGQPDDNEDFEIQTLQDSMKIINSLVLDGNIVEGAVFAKLLKDLEFSIISYKKAKDSKHVEKLQAMLAKVKSLKNTVEQLKE
ncbi:MAG TPA: hypothetical protein VKK79_17370 [Candidatus Lokiarchaeia archaeon]|nr:hypothetical protein [Candidatus Lokiarchaeia archaeon]